MATISEVIRYSRKKKTDGTWNVQIRVTVDRKSAYLETQHWVSAKQIRKQGKTYILKDPFIISLIAPELAKYRDMISALGSRINTYNEKTLAAFLVNGGLVKVEKINVIQFGREQIERLMLAGRDGSARNMITVVNSLQDYFRSDFVPVTEIRSKMLEDYQKFLRTPRTMIRLNQFKKPVQLKFKGLADNGLHNHMRDLRILFNDIVDFYNDEHLGVKIINHYPFKKYKLVELTEKKKPERYVSQFKAIRNCKLPVGSRIQQARDLFLLSFYLCGMNAVDLYQIKPGIALQARLEYNRSKTKRRTDKAFISVPIHPVAMKLYKKYAGTLQDKYSTHNSLDRALSIGMNALSTKLNIPELEFMDARRMFGSWARNICRCSKDDVGLGMNHKYQSNQITDIYITKDWSIIDEVQSKVIELVRRRSKKFLRWKRIVGIQLKLCIQLSRH